MKRLHLCSVYRRAIGIVVGIGLLAVITVANRLYFRQVEPHFDFVAFWSAGRAVARGQDPYDAGVMAELQAPAGHDSEFYSPFYYPLWTGLLFLPLGLLPLHWAAAAWQTLNQVMLLAAIGLVMAGERWRPKPLELSVVLFCGLVFHPVLVAFLDGQVSVLLLFLLSAHFRLLRAGGNGTALLAAGGLVALMAIKPQLALVTVPALLIYMSMRRQWMGIAGFAGVFGGMAGISWCLAPGWLGDWLDGRRQQVAISRIVPSAWGLAHDLWPELWLALAGTMCVASLAWLSAQWWRDRNGDHLDLTLAFTVIVGQFVAPFIWVYDQTLLLFPFVVGMAGESARRRRGWRVALCLWAAGLPYVLYALANLLGRATAHALLPVVLYVILLGSSRRVLGRSGRAESGGRAR